MSNMVLDWIYKLYTPAGTLLRAQTGDAYITAAIATASAHGFLNMGWEPALWVGAAAFAGGLVYDQVANNMKFVPALPRVKQGVVVVTISSLTAMATLVAAFHKSPALSAIAIIPAFFVGAVLDLTRYG